MEKTILVVAFACLCLLTPSFALDFSKSFQKNTHAPSESGTGEESNNNIDPQLLTTYPPATDPRKFSYNINDGIEGALQIRHETWESGVVKGYYTYPLGDKMWQLVHYIADAQGYRITSTKSLTEGELLKMSDQTMDLGSANVQLEEDGLKTNYKINKNDINQEGKKPVPIPIPIQLKKVREAAELAEQMKEQLDKTENGSKTVGQDEKLKSTEDKKDQKENETIDAKSSSTSTTNKDQKAKKKFPLKYQDSEV